MALGTGESMGNGSAVCNITVCCSYCCSYRSQGVSGKEVTPFILAKVNELMEGKSLAASILFVLIDIFGNV